MIHPHITTEHRAILLLIIQNAILCSLAATMRCPQERNTTLENMCWRIGGGAHDPLIPPLSFSLLFRFKCLNRKMYSFVFILMQAVVDSKHYGNVEVYNILKARGAKNCGTLLNGFWIMGFALIAIVAATTTVRVYQIYVAR